MRIVQLIDSLEAGGAERMAVSYANALSNKVAFSGIVASRNEGALKSQIIQQENYLFLNKKGNLDVKAFFKFRKFIVNNRINYIHAHGSSYFWATLIKLIHSKVKIIWHDHFGNRISNKTNTSIVLKICSLFFFGIIAVNEDLKNWSKQHLYCKKVTYLPNFVSDNNFITESKTLLKGINGKRIVFLANLKNPKNHLFFLDAFNQIHSSFSNWTLHLIGKDYQDDYSKKIKDYILKNDLKNCVFIYDSCNDISNILHQSTIGILASTYEGFPVTLLEYGKAKLIVLSTNVGYCSSIINNEENGFLFNPTNLVEITSTLEKIIFGIEKQDETILKIGKRLNQTINDNFTGNIVIHKYIEFIEN